MSQTRSFSSQNVKWKHLGAKSLLTVENYKRRENFKGLQEKNHLNKSIMKHFNKLDMERKIGFVSYVNIIWSHLYLVGRTGEDNEAQGAK